jgi:large subunit ribosomal protein L23
MSQERLTQIILRPIISEKSAIVADNARQVVFKVRTDATKPEIKQAVEFLFDVQVEKVRVANVKGKNKRFGAVMGKRSDWSKAYVTLKEGHDIDFAGGA